LTDILVTIIEIVAIIVFSIFAGEYVRRALARFAVRAGATYEVASAVKDAVRIVWILAMISAILVVSGVATEFQGLTIGAVAGLAVSLALQTTLTNILAGVLFFYDNTLRLNDQILYGAVKGTVIRISLRNTWIKDNNGDITIVSNNSLQNGPFTNYTARERLLRKL
jgi:small conductance mechanosensitive channel